jgi:superfamily I DNA/RNA helicase
VFLHPSQLEAVSAEMSQDIVVVGGPGTGKTVALVHRARRVAEFCTELQKVLLVCHSPQAVADIKAMLQDLVGRESSKW